MIAGKEVEVTIEQAQQLKDKLNNLFGTTENHTHIIYPTIERVVEKIKPYPFYDQPYCQWHNTDREKIFLNNDTSTTALAMLGQDDHCKEIF